jgi:hypothetical protein
MRNLFAPLAALCLIAVGAGCNLTQTAQSGTAAVDPSVAKFIAKVNATIAKDAAKVATAYCPKAMEIAGAASIAAIFTSGATSIVIGDARSFVATFCDSPPSNTSQALALGQQLLRDAVSLGLVTL